MGMMKKATSRWEKGIGSAIAVDLRFQKINYNSREGLNMKKYKIIFDGVEQDEEFTTEEAAEDYALYLCSCSRVGAETLHWSNPGDYDYDEETFEDPEFEIVEVE